MPVSSAQAQVELKRHIGENGYIQVKKLTCARLANTCQEDADLPGVRYSGWLNARAKSRYINVERTKAGIHEVIVYCKANPDKLLVDAVDVILGQARAGRQ